MYLASTRRMVFPADEFINSSRNAFGDLGLKLEDVRQFSLITSSPYVPVFGGVDELRSDSDLLAVKCDGALDHRIHIQFSGNSRQALVGVFVSHHGGSRNHP